jgi:CRP-like cAMP-binding protein
MISPEYCTKKQKATTPKDCDLHREYLNSSDPDSANHTCAACPFGAWCEGETTWSNVTARFGFYRVYDDAADKTPNVSDANTLPNDRERPPVCLDEEINSPEPKCAFRQCLYPAACLGKNNDKFEKRFLEGSDYFNTRVHLPAEEDTTDDQDLAAYRHWNESCDEDRGYANECTDTHGQTVRCRLCGTCKRGYKRVGSGAQCALCPPPSINFVLLVGGVSVMIIGSAVLIFVTIQASIDLKDDLSDDLKKVVVNFLQISSLAGALPLKWPSAVQSLFETFNTISSAGSNLLIPDCEFSHLKAADVYFGKQIAFALLVPMLLVVVVTAWALIFACSRFVVKRKGKKRLKMRDAKDYTVLSCVFLIFLVYPFLTRMIFSMLKCPQIGDRSYLVADLQEECFGSESGHRHSAYFGALTIPQIFIYVAGLPIGIFLLLKRNKDKVASNDKSFRIRYGFLFIGFRKDRAWWETVTAARKVAVVIIGTFGTVIASPNLQAFLAILIIFISIILHLTAEPFDVTTPSGKLLHQVELAALTVNFLTFWSGLIFFLDQEVVSDWVRIVMTCLLVIGNIVFVIYSVYLFVKAFLKDMKDERMKKRQSKLLGLKIADSSSTAVQVLPVVASSSSSSNPPSSSLSRIRRTRGSGKTAAEHADRLHAEHLEHERRLHEKNEKRFAIQRKHTQQRVQARSALRRSKALQKVELFQHLEDDAISDLVAEMEYESPPTGAIIVKEGDIADALYVLVKGQCGVYVRQQKQIGQPASCETDDVDVGTKVGTLNKLDIFGENALLSGSDDVAIQDEKRDAAKSAVVSKQHRRRNATVVVESESIQLLKLTRDTFDVLVESGKLGGEGEHQKDVREMCRRVSMTRVDINRKLAGSNVAGVEAAGNPDDRLAAAREGKEGNKIAAAGSEVLVLEKGE